MFPVALRAVQRVYKTIAEVTIIKRMSMGIILFLMADKTFPPGVQASPSRFVSLRLPVRYTDLRFMLPCGLDHSGATARPSPYASPSPL